MLNPLNDDQQYQAQDYNGIREALLKNFNGANLSTIEDDLVSQLPYIKAELTGKYFLFKTQDRINQRVQFSDVISANGQKIFVLADGTQLQEHELGSTGEFLDGAGGLSGFAAQSISDPNILQSDLDILGYNSPTNHEPEDPISILLREAQIDPIDVALTLQLKIPPQQLRELIRKFYKGADEKIALFALKSVDQGELMGQIRVAIESYIKETEE